MTNLDSVLKSRDITLLKKVHTVKAMLLSGHIWLDCKEGRMPKNWCLQTVLLEKPPESPLDSKEIKPVNLKGNQPWIVTGRTDAKAEAPVFWSSDTNRQLFGKVHDAGIKGRRRRGCQSMRRLDGIPDAMNISSGKFQEMVRHREAWRATVSPRGHKELDVTGWLNNKKLINIKVLIMQFSNSHL